MNSWGSLERSGENPDRRQGVERLVPGASLSPLQEEIDHLDAWDLDSQLEQAMDALRESVGLRGYGQKDPLIEYKNEGYDMFLEMMTQMRRNVIYSMFMFQPTPAVASTTA